MRLFYISAIILLFYCSLSAQVPSTIQVERGWNLLSLPVKTGDAPISTLFPSAISDAFLWNDGYIHRDTINNGGGFWLKFDSAETFVLYGESIHRDTVDVVEGWNMIGSITEILNVTMVRTEPPEIIISDFFNYNPQSGYEASKYIMPGVGYWVKVSQSGSIILSAGLPCQGMPTVTYVGKVYNTVQIGSQCWLKENLDVGTMILGASNSLNNGMVEKYCYNNDTLNCNTYGALYQWNEAMEYKTIAGTQGICPAGWHIPTYEEFETLSSSVGGSGNALKALEQGAGDGMGTNTTGFSALLAGDRNYYEGGFTSLGQSATFWISNESGPESAQYMYLSVSYNNIGFWNYSKLNGFSVRCLRD